MRRVERIIPRERQLLKHKMDPLLTRQQDMQESISMRQILLPVAHRAKGHMTAIEDSSNVTTTRIMSKKSSLKMRVTSLTRSMTVP